MTKRIFLFLLLSSFYLFAQAQWTKKDSINLHRLLESDGEIKLNPNVLKQLKIGKVIGVPLYIDDESALKANEALPSALPEKKKMMLTLMPYSANTKFNYDPVYKKSISVKENTYKSNPFEMLYSLTIPSNWAKHPLDGGYRRSLEEIEATGLRYNPLAARANNMAVGAWEGTGASGYDFSKPFTKEFWDKKGRKRRARTLDVLNQYGDSTTVFFRDGVPGNKVR
ncbi:DUF4858 domain-containing protein [Bacteroides ihuae]|uniref:DUF4858 domain-containing protein n=1 Tax=Bacteroides ihuae TaxID=1852362 RepID=UPI0008DA6C9E|nr:DUF4858 domain-containing protein [Bacteroides ihuae]